MKERPIIFSAPMVPALLDGTKTQTRRVAKGRHPIGFLGGSDQIDDPACWGWFFDGPEQHGYAVLARGLNERWDGGRVSIPCPYGEPGARFYVKERWDYFGGDEYIYQREPGAVMYEADCDLTQIGRRWRNPMFMPKWAARLWYELTDVRAQRVQDISEEDARAEGVDALDGLLDEAEICRLAKLAGCMATDNRSWFAAAWEMIHGRGAWERNDWVWALSFRRVERTR